MVLKIIVFSIYEPLQTIKSTLWHETSVDSDHPAQSYYLFVNIVLSVDFKNFTLKFYK